tara:strand:+ start:3046 stop:3486 length:441 start_codon:yes stop_codon:yes gene_type:complete
MSLPFELAQYHKCTIKGGWKYRGLICSDNDFNFHIYPRYIWATHCELCNKKFETSKDRCMEHSNIIGKFRNIVCQKCNHWKWDYKRKNDVSPYIRKVNQNKCKQGFNYKFKVERDKIIRIERTSIDLNKLEEFRDKWIVDNPQWFT